MQQRTFTFLFLFLFPLLAIAQNNDECIDAVRIDEVSNYCSDPGEFNNLSATQSATEPPACFPATDFFDVWFVFTAQATDASISIRGAELNNAGGTIRTPQFALYTGTCDDLTELRCTSPLGVATTAQSITGNLRIGQDYYIRVSAAVERRGTFQLCINNFNAVPEVSSDCEPGLVLCDKSPFTLTSVETSGNNPNEINDIFCQDGRPVTEDQSTWFKWICEDPGTLEFDLLPIDPDDDLDFVLYELPNGLNDCSNKRPLRIMLSGRNGGDETGDTWRICVGNTGLRNGEDDERENCGCDPDDNNYIRPIDMVAGRAYALVVMNFTETGNGFTIEFGGTGTFRGPEIDFSTNLIALGQTAACVGQEIQITDASFFEGGLVDWSWDFGPNASVRDTVGEGPFNISFDRPGIQQVLLSVTSVDGCILSEIVNLNVICCETQFSIDAAISNATCPDASDGAIDLSARSDFGITDIEWNTGAVDEDIGALARGVYEVTITDNATCTISRTYEVGSPDTFSIATDITMPTCDGGEDGAITL
ncbi:MAG: hypothetical protein AAF242_05560, partial [Bacteroidota bacterium]